MTVSIAQFGAGENKEENLRRIGAFARQAAGVGAAMLLCPEFSMFCCAGKGGAARIRQAAEPLDGPFVAALGALARQYGLWIAAGLYEKTGGLPYNTAVVLDHTGSLRGFHRKNRLYDALGYRESDECRAGTRPFRPVETPCGRLGVITCYELRFPALAAEQRSAGAAVLYVPAGWMEGANKRLHWRTLLCARAIENGMTVLGAGQYAEGRFTGCSAAFAPDGGTLGALETGSGLLTIAIGKG